MTSGVPGATNRQWASGGGTKPASASWYLRRREAAAIRVSLILEHPRRQRIWPAPVHLTRHERQDGPTLLVHPEGLRHHVETDAVEVR